MTSLSAGLFHALLLSILYVASLYVWRGALDTSRNNPMLMRRRILSIGAVTIISLLYSIVAGLLHGELDSIFPVRILKEKI